MTRRSRSGTSYSPMAFVLLGLALLPIGIGCATPTMATTTVPAGTPAITSVAPLPVIGNASPQTLQFNGQNFDTGLTLTGIGPTGTITVSGGSLLNVSATSFSVSIVVGPGTYQFTISSGAGVMSQPFSLVVIDPNAATGPELVAISPATPSHGAAPQQLFVSGVGFVSGMTVTLMDQFGNITIVSGPDIINPTSTTFDLNVTLAKAGQYSMQVTLPDSEISNTLNFRVN